MSNINYTSHKCLMKSRGRNHQYQVKSKSKVNPFVASIIVEITIDSIASHSIFKY